MNNIEIKNVTKKYDGFLLDKISFNVPAGSIGKSVRTLCLNLTYRISISKRS